MDFLHRYILGISCAAVLCGLALMFFQKNAALKEALRFVTGMIMIVAIISPVVQINLNDYSTFWEELSLSTQDYVSNGTQFYEETLRERITQDVQAYILDKAAYMNVGIEASVILSDEATPVPRSVKIYGNLSPTQRQQLSETLCNDLNITKENIIWTSNP